LIKKDNYLQSKLKETTLFVQMDETTKLRSFVLLSLLAWRLASSRKSSFQARKEGLASIKDEVVSLFLNRPAAQDKMLSFVPKGN
jgi:hypothetical protein